MEDLGEERDCDDENTKRFVIINISFYCVIYLLILDLKFIVM